MKSIWQPMCAAVTLLALLAASPVTRGEGRKTVNLIPLINIDTDTVSGSWRMQGKTLVSGRDGTARLRIPYEPPKEYDFHIVFLRRTGDDTISQVFRDLGNSCMWTIGGWHNTGCGLGNIDGMDAANDKNPTKFHGQDLFSDGQKYSSLVRVRKDSVVTSINGKVISTYRGSAAALSVQDGWGVGDDGLGLGSINSAVEFSVVEVTEISGPGKASPRNAPAVESNPPPPPPAAADTATHADPVPDENPTDAPAVRPASPQTSIKCLEVQETDSGMMLGQTSEITLTVTPGKDPKLVAVRFVTPIGDEMSLARDDALRFIRVKYPNWKADKAEITFEDKYVPHDGGSIGAAVGTAVLSVIQGFQIDPDVAMTGDISANGKVRAIGGVSAKLQGAIAGKCSCVALPTENYDQLVDAVVYGGPAIVEKVQVIGISSFADAVATVRTDRDVKLKQAIEMFASFQHAANDNPNYFKSKAAETTLEKVLELAPNHLSAKLLLDLARGKLPTTLSVTASNYYTAVAVHQMLDIMNQRVDSNGAHDVPSTALHQQLVALRKLQPIANPAARPLIHAWGRFMETLANWENGNATTEGVEASRQALLDEMDKEQQNADLMQKTLKEGV